MRIRLAVSLLVSVLLAALLPLGGSSATNAGWQTFSVATGGFSVQLPSTWVDVSSASATVLKKLESNPALRALVAALNGTNPLKLLVADSANVSAFMDVSAVPVGTTTLPTIAKSSAAAIRKAFQVSGAVQVEQLKLPAGSADVLSATISESGRGKVAIIEYLLVKSRVLYAVEYSAPAATKARYTKTFTRSAASFRLLPPVDLSGVVLSAGQVGSGYQASMIPSGNQVIGQPTLDLCNQTYASENLRTGRLQDEYLHGHGIPASNEIVTYTSGGAREALGEVEKVLAACTKPITQGTGAKKVTTTTSRFTDPRLPAGSVAVRIHITGTSKGKPVQANIIAIYQVAGNTLSGVYAYDNSGNTAAAATTLAVHAAIASSKKLKSFLLAS